MLDFLHLAPGADWVVVFMAVCGGFALYIGIGVIMDDFGRDLHELIKAYKEEKARKNN